VLANANAPLTKIGQGVIQGSLQTFLFHMKDMHRLTLKFKEDMEFQRGINIK
jgi:hypothetical protein